MRMRMPNPAGFTAKEAGPVAALLAMALGCNSSEDGSDDDGDYGPPAALVLARQEVRKRPKHCTKHCRQTILAS